MYQDEEKKTSHTSNTAEDECCTQRSRQRSQVEGKHQEEDKRGIEEALGNCSNSVILPSFALPKQPLSLIRILIIFFNIKHCEEEG